MVIDNDIQLNPKGVEEASITSHGVISNVNISSHGVLNGTLNIKGIEDANIISRGEIKSVNITSHGAMGGQLSVSGGRGSGCGDYRLLTNKPRINGIELFGNKTNAELGIPTDTGDLTNSAGFINNTVDSLINYYLKSETYTKQEIEDLIAAIQQGKFEVVDDLPLIGEPYVIYLVPKKPAQSRNIYDEYIYVNNRWERIGDTEIDLTNYVTKDELTRALQRYITNEMLNIALSNYYNKADVNQMMADKVDIDDLGIAAITNDYNDLDNTPLLGTAASKDVPEIGDAKIVEVVMGSDSRLSDAREASDVYAWAKSSTKPMYTPEEIGAVDVNNEMTLQEIDRLFAAVFGN